MPFSNDLSLEHRMPPRGTNGHDMTFLKTTTAGALCALCTTPALGQEVLTLDTITVSGSLTPPEIARTGASVEVIDGQDVALTDTKLIDRLDRLPGVNSVGNGPLGSNTSSRSAACPGAMSACGSTASTCPIPRVCRTSSISAG